MTGFAIDRPPLRGFLGSDWSWAPVFLDVDLDGFEDLLIGAGHFRDVQDYDAEAVVQSRQHSWEGFASEAERVAFLFERYRQLTSLLPAERSTMSRKRKPR